MSPNDSYPQHVVTAVIVAHDGAAWLPQLAGALLGQNRPVQRIVAVDTGSRDRSGAVLASQFGQQSVFGMERSTGYGTAIARALHHRAASAPVAQPVGVAGSGQASAIGGPGGGYGGPGGSYVGRPQSPSDERIEWLWLLHDDCEPAPDALEQLLRGATETSAAAVLGPKLRDWSNRDMILEAGLTLDTAARRLTGIESREVDQGQHDGDRDALAVSSAGMLVRRDVWDEVGGFDRTMGLFMDDIDFCWRVHSAGYRVRVITDAVVFHAQAAARRRRSISVGRRPRMLDRRNALLTLLGNLPFWPMVTSAGGNVLVSLLRIVFFLLAKRLAAAVDEFTAMTGVLCHPIRLIKRRRARSRGRRAAYSRVRADLPPGRSARRVVEFVVSALSRSQPDTVGSHHASADPAEDDSMLIDNGLGRRLLTSPALLTFVALLALAIAAGRSLIGAGPLGGGSLVPAWGGASDLWGTYLQTFHPTGIGSTTPAPPWLAVIAALSTVLAGKPWLAIDVIMIGCVPLAGMTAMLAVRKVTTSAPLRVWASATYALLPVATGVIASGRLGAAVAFVLLPLIVGQVGRMLTRSGPPAGRAAWATGLLVAIAGAFVPVLWLIIVAVCLVGATVLRRARGGALRNLAIVTLAPPVLLLPWTLAFLSHPAQLLTEAGLPQQADPAGRLPARSLLLLSPGGPGLPPYWVTAGLLAVAFAALFAGRKRRVIAAGWGLALAGLLAAAVISHVVVRSADVGPVALWPGLPLALAALGLLLAAVAGADSLGRLLAGVKGWRAIFSGRGPWAALLGLIACSAPVLAAASWVTGGVSGPVHVVRRPVVPELVAVAAGQTRQVRTLVLTSARGRVSYLLLRGPSPSLADAALTPPADAQRALARVVSTLVTAGGALAADQTQLLADFDIGYILVQAPVDQQLATTLNNVTGLKPYSSTSGYALWQLDKPPARVSVAEPDGTVVPIPSGQVGVAGAQVPAAGGTLLLAEPAGDWTASVNGHALQQVQSPAGSWAAAFRLPPGGGTLSIAHPALARDLELGFELLALLIVVALALPGIRLADQEAQAAARTRDDAASASADGEARTPLTRVAQAGAGRGAAAGGARTARTMAGRAKTRRSGLAAGWATGAAAADKGAADLARASAARRAAGGRRGAVPRQRDAGSDDRRQRDSAEVAGRLADAWPYAEYDARRADDRPAGASQDAESGPRRGDGSRADARPYAAAEPKDARSDHDDFGSTDPSGRPYRDGEREFGGDRRPAARRHAAGRSPVGDSPDHELDKDSGRGRRAGSGLPGWGRRSRHESGSRSYKISEPGASGPGRYGEPDLGGRPGRYDEPGRPGRYDAPGRNDERDLAGRPGGYEEPDQPGGSNEPGLARRPWRRAAADSAKADPGEPDPAGAARANGRDRGPAGRHGRHGTSRRARSGAGRRDPQREDQGHAEVGRPEAEQHDSAVSGWRRRGPAGRDPGSAVGRPERAEAEQPPAWSDEVLEPLPPLEPPGRAQGYRSARHSIENASGWDRFGENDDADPEWSPLQPEFEPEYEGDSW